MGGTVLETLSIEQGSSIRLAGELDMSSASDLDDVLKMAVERGGAVLVDLGELSFMDSTGITAFLRAAVSLRGRGCLILHGEQDAVRRVLDLVGFNGAIPNLHRLSHEVVEPAADAETAYSEVTLPPEERASPPRRPHQHLVP